MKERKNHLTGVAVAALITGIMSAPNAMADKPGMEKCYGVSKAGKNDCGNKAHGCSAKAKKDSDKTEWIYVNKGLCEKIANSSLTAPKS